MAKKFIFKTESNINFKDHPMAIKQHTCRTIEIDDDTATQTTLFTYNRREVISQKLNEAFNIKDFTIDNVLNYSTSFDITEVIQSTNSFQ